MATKCNCPMETTTNHQTDYKLLDKIKPIKLHHHKPSCDQELISGLIGNNLLINGKGIKSKIWPGLLNKAEEYEAYVQRLKTCRKDIYDLYYKSHTIDNRLLEKMAKNLSKSCYQLVFSPDDFVSLRNHAKDFATVNSMKYKETTYDNFYSCIKEMEMFQVPFRKDLMINKERLELKNELRKIYRCGRSTYNDAISKPAAIGAKPTLPGPIDRYTLRRI
ncbi:uncharacterized protein LOC106090230 [Stomoxys calcitrans]|uniref:Uncharacterized protein n=1 Tax=Stomoxys calcitrans TaxID=35570 RepID=A0A1I8PBF9_STOCA|nr:uncharacterized protein LOC106090230 [Stomoxys calcitrans]